MKFLVRLLSGMTIAGLLALEQTKVARANGGGLHVGTMHIPAIILWIGGGILVAFFLFFFVGWSLSSRAKKDTQPEKKEETPKN
ncbi:MAG: hypothetical protein HYU83_02305 [Chloroflexi bacterium]|nr:hypothetical protein [Chloroflexota bacterium]